MAMVRMSIFDAFDRDSGKFLAKGTPKAIGRDINLAPSTVINYHMRSKKGQRPRFPIIEERGDGCPWCRRDLDGNNRTADLIDIRGGETVFLDPERKRLCIADNRGVYGATDALFCPKCGRSLR